MRRIVIGLMVGGLVMMSLRWLAGAGFSQAGGGTIVGTVKLSGSIPPDEEKNSLQLETGGKDLKHCGMTKRSPRLVVDPATKGVKNVIVWLEGVKGAKPPAPINAVLNQKGCEFVPHIQILPVGSTLTITSSDPILHNVNARWVNSWQRGGSPGIQAFNYAIPRPGAKSQWKATKRGLLALQCNAGHIWMSGYILITDHPYYTLTDAKGNFKLQNVPPGTYTIKAWHEGWKVVRRSKDPKTGKTKAFIYDEAQVQEQKVTVQAGKTATVNFEFSP